MRKYFIPAPTIFAMPVSLEPDVVLELASSTLEYTSERQQLVKQAASQTQKHLLIALTCSQWSALNAVSAFAPMQLLLAKLYTAASVVFAERDLPLLRVDIVIDCLRQRGAAGRSSILEEISGNATRLREDKRSTDLPIEQSSGPPLLGTVALGGTFDHLHPGHKVLLTMAGWIADRRLIVGITDEVLLSKKSNKQLLESL